MNKPKIELLSSKTLFKGRVLHLVRERFIYRSKAMQRETILHPGAVVIIPVLPDGNLLLVKQYRHATRKVLFELPAGTLEPPESPRACAARELIEETGWRARRLEKIAQFYSAPGFTSELMHLFLATGLTPGRANPEEDELLTPVVMSLSATLKKIESHQICDAKTIIGVLLASKRLLG
jgi:ADP-ribose pyrophosphatase